MCVGIAISMAALPSNCSPLDGDQSALRSKFESIRPPPVTALMKPSPEDRSISRCPPASSARAEGSTTTLEPTAAAARRPAATAKRCTSSRDPPAWPSSSSSWPGRAACRPLSTSIDSAPLGGSSEMSAGGRTFASRPASKRAWALIVADHGSRSG